MDATKRALGIDGGGTKTDWVVVSGDAGQATVVDRGRLAGSNLHLTSDAVLAGHFAVLPRDVTHVGVFLAGCGTDDDRGRLGRLVAAAWPGVPAVVGSDRDSALATAFGDGDGIVVIAGTGAVVQGRRAGRLEKAGGWGHVVGDRGGAYDLARQGLRLVLSSYDLEHRITPVAERILRELSLNTLADLAAWAVQADKISIAGLAPAIFEAVGSGPPDMLKTVTDGARILAEFAHAVAGRLGFDTPRVALFGGLFVHHPRYASLFQERLLELLPQARVESCPESGAMGAAWLASGIRAYPSTHNAPADAAPELAGALTELSNPRSTDLDRLSTEAIVELFVSEESAVASALSGCRQELARAVDLVSEAMLAGGRLFYVGAGTSGRLGVLDASEIPPTFGTPPELVQGVIAGGAPALHRAVEGAEDQPAAGRQAMIDRGIRARDVVCGITASGRTPFVLGALAQARGAGALTLLLTCNPVRNRFTAWDAEIDLATGPEIVTGSTRLKAGTATKVALNIISTGAMVRLGRVLGNAMADVRISNEKLRDRGARLVSERLGVSLGEARARLERANWSVRGALRDP